MGSSKPNQQPNGQPAGGADARFERLAQAARGDTGVMSMRAHLIGLAASAALLALAFPQPGWGWLAHVALVPAALVALRSTSTRRLAWCAAAVFFIWWVVMLRWLMPVTAGGYVLLAAFMAVWSLAALLALRWLHQRWNVPTILALPVVWVAFEVLRDHVPAGGFGWFMLGYTQAGYDPGHGVGRLVQIADLFGVYGVSFLVAMTNGLIVDGFTRPLIRRTTAGTTRPGWTVALGAPIWLAAIIGAWAYGQYRIAQYEDVTAAGPTIAVVQTNVPQDNKVAPTLETQQRDWQTLIELTRQVGQSNEGDPGPDLLLWPETVVPTGLNHEAHGYMRDAPGYHRSIAGLARHLDAPLVVGAHAYEGFLPEHSREGRLIAVPQRRHNSVYLYRADGEQDAQRYDKVHRVPFGEYMPWVETVPALKDFFIRYLTPYDHDYTLDAGERFTRFELAWRNGTLRFATPICFEDAVGRVCRRMVYGGNGNGAKRVDALLNLTNDGWFAGGAMRAQHVQMATLRTIENRVPMARSVNTGNSAVIDSLGRVTAGLGHNIAGTFTAELTLDDRRTLYGRIGQWPAWLVVVAAGIGIAGGWLRRLRQTRSRA